MVDVIISALADKISTDPEASLLRGEVLGNLTDGGAIDTMADPTTADWHDGKHHATALTGWGPITCILLADMFGLGALTLPSDIARLGYVASVFTRIITRTHHSRWAPGIAAITLCGVGMVYTGVLFTRLATSQPRTGKFDDWGSAAFGRAGRLAVYIVVYGAIMGEPTVFQITCVEVGHLTIPPKDDLIMTCVCSPIQGTARVFFSFMHLLCTHLENVVCVHWFSSST